MIIKWLVGLFEKIKNAVAGAVRRRGIRRQKKEGRKVWKVWHKLKLGAGVRTDISDSEAFLAVLSGVDCRVSDYSKDILFGPAFAVENDEREVSLVVVTGAELGFNCLATRADIYERAQELGLDLCPAEVGPQLRLQYTDQPAGEWLLIGMEPIAVSDGCVDIFCVTHRAYDGKKWLLTGNGAATYTWKPDNQWVFLRRE